MSLARVEPPALTPSTGRSGGLEVSLEVWKESAELAKYVSSTDFVPKSLRGNPAAVLACFLHGHEIGFGPMQSLRSIYMIDGRPGMAAEAMRALVLRHGHRLWTEDFTQTRVTLCGARSGEDVVQRVTWTLDDAKRAGLTNRDSWRRYPRALLLARATGELCRLLFADVLAGMSHSIEELEDLDDEPASEDGETPPPRTTARATKANAKRGARKAAVQPAAPAQPASPPLPGEEGYETLESGSAGNAGDASSHGPAGGASSDPPSLPPAGPPTERRTDTTAAQEIAMKARRKGIIDHHEIVDAVTEGRKHSAKDLTTAETQQVLEAIDAADESPAPPWETFERDNAQLMEVLHSLTESQRTKFKAWRIEHQYKIPPRDQLECRMMRQHAEALAASAELLEDEQ